MQLFDSHLHIVDPRFPLVSNAGFVPRPFTVEDYLARVSPLGVVGGAVVSGSFQAYDQAYLGDALMRLGPGFVGVTQLPPDATEGEVRRLARNGVRALRFNLRRGVHPGRRGMERLAHLVWDIAGWHTELYMDAADIPDLEGLLASLPLVAIDHLGLSRRGLPHLLRLVERGARVKATGFGRVDLPLAETVRAVARADPNALMFGTDLPGTRAPRAFEPSDLGLLEDSLDDVELVRRVMFENALELYRPAEAPN